MGTSSMNLENWISQIASIVKSNFDNLATEQFDETYVITHPDFDVEYNSDLYWQLTDKEKEFCRQALRNHFEIFLTQLQSSNVNWRDLSDWLCQLDNYSNVLAEAETLYNLSKETIEHTLFIKNERLLNEVKQSFEKIFFPILISKEDFPTHDLFALSDEDLILRGELVVRSKSSLEIVKFLQGLKKRIDEYRSKYSDLSYLDLESNPKIIQRNTQSLDRWINNSLMMATPPIEFLSRAQIDILRDEVIRIAATTQLDFSNNLVEHFDLMIRLKSVALGKLDFKPFASVEKITPDSQPAVVIRYLIFGIQSLNPKYKRDNELKNLKIWISTLFCEIPGFSYDNVRKALERNKRAYPSTRPD